MKINLSEGSSTYPVPWMDYYVDIMNLLDHVALSDRDLTEEEIDRLEFLSDHGGGNIPDIADANDCGYCDTWDDLVYALRDLHRTGERISIN